MAQVFDVDMSGFTKFIANLSKNNRIKAENELRSTAIDIQGSSARNISDNGTSATGQLASSGRVRRQGKYWTVGYYTKYAASVEFGRKAGYGISAQGMITLRQWVRRKLRVAEKDVNGVAFVIARKIKQRGTRPQPFLYPAYKKHVKGLERRIIKSIIG